MEAGHVIYHVYLGSAEAVTTAAEQLVRAGFAVTPQADDADGFALEASMAAEVDRANDALAQVLSGIDHGPVIEWHVGRLTGFIQGS